MRVAFDKIKIKPKNYIGMQMAGYETQDPCSGILDDIYAYGVLIETSDNNKNKNYLMLISLDLMKLPISIAEYVKKKIMNEFRFLKSEQILTHCTHTHSAPDLTGEYYYTGGFLRGAMFGLNRNDKYIVYLVNRIFNMTRNLFNDLKPCKIAWAKKPFNPAIVINRRHPTRRSKPDLGVIAFKSLNNNEMIGFIINYACHPTTLTGMNSKMSADYPGRIVDRINELTNNKIKVVYFNGPSGDLNPITTCGTDYERLEKDKKPIYAQKGTYYHTKKLGHILADESLKLANSIKEEEFSEKMEFISKTRNILIPMRDYKYFSNIWFQNFIPFALKKYVIIPITKIMSENANFPAFIIKRRKLRLKCYSIIQYIKMKSISTANSKEISIITIPGELFEDLGKLLLKYSPTGSKNTFIFQNANDWIGYHLSFTEYAKFGGYEPIASVGPIIGEYVTKKMLNLFNEIKNQ